LSTADLSHVDAAAAVADVIRPVAVTALTGGYGNVLRREKLPLASTVAAVIEVEPGVMSTLPGPEARPAHDQWTPRRF
jgi:hypothetical protein